MAVSESESLIPEQVAIKYLYIGRGVDSCETIAHELGTRTWRVWPIGAVPRIFAAAYSIHFSTPILFVFAMRFSLFSRSYASFATERYAFQSLLGFLSR